ncbi:aldo/keto reductase [Nocardiopsis sp. TSRI0078]|uniref:aldo/keto reductase n=1 Tax=unclassified Nocardiopsis TaxID=2649073 RepID=UPI0009391551|nr:aldo/keto reductase [Nocardiopsis sp. TSRI0078]OKI13089.1 aldo/keto reductase [Nocardiopsis sp. TSRI0078]
MAFDAGTRTRLGRSEVFLGPLGLGTAPIGNGTDREVDEETALGAVLTAWDAGVRYFDTAPHYGLGLAERRLGRALAGLPRDRYVVSTKVGRLLEPAPHGAGRLDDQGFAVPASHTRRWDFSADGVRRSLEESLERLGLDRVDVVLLHDPDHHWEQAVGEAYPALHELRDQGVVGAIGAGMNQARMLERFAVETDMDVVLLAGRYTLLDQRAAATMLPACRREGVSVIAAGVFNSGILAVDEPPGDATYDYGAAPDRLRARALRIARVCRRHGVTLPRAAMAFSARHPAVAGVLVGARSAEEVARNAGLLADPVPEILWADLEAEGLVVPGTAG